MLLLLPRVARVVRVGFLTCVGNNGNSDNGGGGGGFGSGGGDDGGNDDDDGEKEKLGVVIGGGDDRAIGLRSSLVIRFVYSNWTVMIRSITVRGRESA